jgi:hypothetical protein
MSNEPKEENIYYINYNGELRKHIFICKVPIEIEKRVMLDE